MRPASARTVGRCSSRRATVIAASAAGSDSRRRRRPRPRRPRAARPPRRARRRRGPAHRPSRPGAAARPAGPGPAGLPAGRGGEEGSRGEPLRASPAGPASTLGRGRRAPSCRTAERSTGTTSPRTRLSRRPAPWRFRRCRDPTSRAPGHRLAPQVDHPRQHETHRVEAQEADVGGVTGPRAQERLSGRPS